MIPVRALALVLTLLLAVSDIRAQGADYVRIMNEALAEGAALRRAGQLPGIPADSSSKLLLTNLPPPKANLQFPLSVTLVVEAGAGHPAVSLFLTKERSDSHWVVSSQPAVREPALREELLQLMDKDQAVRKDWVTRRNDPAYAQEMAAVDEVGTARIKAIVTQFGWPSIAMVGRDGARAAFLLVQHADRDRAFQRAALPLLEAAFRTGDVDGPEYALLVDRVRVGEGRPQLYGSQCAISADGSRWVPYPIEHPAEVDARRAEVGLNTLAEYLEFLNREQPIKNK